MRAVNLLPRDDPKGRGLPSPWVLLAATVPVVAGSLVYLGYSSEHSGVVENTARLAVVQAQIDKLSRAQAVLNAQSDLVGLRAQRQSALQDALSKSVAWDVTLTDLARVLPKGVSLTSLNAQSPTPAGSAYVPSSTTPAAPAGGAAFMLQGVADNHDQIAMLLERLSLLPMLTNVTLGSTTTTQPTVGAGTGTGPAPAQVNFQLSATLVTPPPPTAGT
jgi:Tfp pilus assembly protein PilN